MWTKFHEFFRYLLIRLGLFRCRSWLDFRSWRHLFCRSSFWRFTFSTFDVFSVGFVSTLVFGLLFLLFTCSPEIIKMFKFKHLEDKYSKWKKYLLGFFAVSASISAKSAALAASMASSISSNPSSSSSLSSFFLGARLLWPRKNKDKNTMRENDQVQKSTVFENHRKSLIQHCERSELRLHFEWTKVD